MNTGHAANAPIQRYHLKLDSDDLAAFSGHVTARVWRQVIDHIPRGDKSSELYLAVRGAVEQELREHVVGMGLCGLAAVCTESAEYDPWPDAEESPTGVGKERA